MSSGGPRKIAESLRYLCLAGGAAYLLTYLLVALLRIGHPYELEWLEGGALEHVRRILAGGTLYVEPSLEFIPFIYTPLYFYLSALVAKIVGAGFVPLRFVSLLSSVGSLVLIHRFVRRETGEGFPAFLAMSLFAATYRISGAWFDLARVDSLALVLMLGGLYLVRFHTSAGSAAAAGILLALSFFTKQIALVIAIPVVLSALLLKRRFGVVLLAVTAGAILAGSLGLNALHDGWFATYAFDLPRRHAVLDDWYVRFWVRELMAPLGIACGLALLYFFARASEEIRDRPFVFHLLATAGMVGGACVSRMHEGSYFNALIPAYAMLAILFGLAIHEALSLLDRAGGRRRELFRAYLFVLCLIQLALLMYDPRGLLPDAASRDAGDRVVEGLRNVRGEVFVPYHPYLATRAGKAPTAHGMAIEDVLRGGGEMADALAGEIRSSLAARRYSLVIIDHSDFRFREEIEKDYRLSADLARQGPALWTVTGLRAAPRYVYTPRDDAP